MNYYVLEPVSLDHTPALGYKTGELILGKATGGGKPGAGKPVADDMVIDLKVLTKPKATHAMGDYMRTPEPLLCPRVLDIFQSFDLPDVQYLSTTVEMAKGKPAIDTHTLVLCLNFLDVIDHENSVFTTFTDGGINRVKSLRLLTDKLAEVPATQRQFFRLTGKTVIKVVNQELADALNAADIPDLRLIPVEEWHASLNLTPRRLKKLGLE